MTPESKVIEIDSRRPERTANTKRTRKAKKKRLKAGDFCLTALVLGLVTFGVIMIFSASYYYAISEEGTPYYYLIRSIMWAVVGTVAMLFMAVFDYHKLQKAAWLILLLSLILLCLLFTPLGVTLNNATRWLDFKVFTIMPGELAKPACIVFAAAFLSKKPNRIRSLTDGILPMALLAGIVGFLIYKQPNTSTAITVVVIIAGIMFIAGLDLRWVAGAGAAGVAGIAIVILKAMTVSEASSEDTGYRMGRIVSFLDPFADPQGSGYQVIQGLLAMGSGGLFGVGLGKSMQKTLYLPEPQNDFILAIIGEELGYIGLVILLIAYLLLVWRCVHICINAPDTFGMLLASGITIMLAVQVILNIMVVTSMMPPTGIILPFVSWGGNALVIFMACMGIMLNVSRHSAK